MKKQMQETWPEKRGQKNVARVPSITTKGLGGVRDVASAIISYEQTQSNRVCCFQTLDAIFPKDLLSDYLENTTAVVVPCGGPKKSPRTSI